MKAPSPMILSYDELCELIRYLTIVSDEGLATEGNNFQGLYDKINEEIERLDAKYANIND